MRLLLDESLPSKLGFALTSHRIRTVQQMDLSVLENGKLLAAQDENGNISLIATTK